MTFDYPGVYIRELPAESPIQGVGTSTAGFIGVCRGGPVNLPTFVTSFDEFRQRFDDTPLDGFFLWYAVRGFFENGGRRAYIVRASSGRGASLSLDDSRGAGAQPALLVDARQLGVPAPAIQVTVTHTSAVTADAFRPTATIAAGTAGTDRVQLAAAADAPNFRLGDQVLLEQGGTSETTTLSGVQGDLLLLATPLANSYTGGSARLVDLAAGDRVLRLESAAAALAPGSVIELAQGGTTSGPHIVALLQAERISPTLVTYRVELENPLTAAFDRSGGAAAITATSQEFDLVAAQNGTSDTFANLSMDRRHPRYIGTVIAGMTPLLVSVAEPPVPSNAALPERRPATVANQPLAGGANDEPQNLTLADYQEALDSLRLIDDVNFIAIPDSVDPAVQLALLTHCTQLGDRVAIFDPPPGVPPNGPGSVLDRIALLRSERGFGALYYPWIIAPRPTGGTLVVPPSGHVAGIYARADIERGVHKAPANFALNGSLGVMTEVNNEAQGPLNLAGVNVLRVFPGQARPVVWGARTTSDQTAWQYVNIRRLLLFIEESLEEGLRWAVFEPNDPKLWAKLRRVITAFLRAVWRDGALFGLVEEEAFFVRIDETNNPPAERQLGRLYITIGLRPVYPAEFIIVEIGLWPGGSDTNEL
jgi:phage tail sheath protein FI